MYQTMTKQELLRALRRPYACYAGVTRSSIDSKTGIAWDRRFLLHKGMLISSIQAAEDTELFTVEIEVREKTTRHSQDHLTIHSRR